MVVHQLLAALPVNRATGRAAAQGGVGEVQNHVVLDSGIDDIGDRAVLGQRALIAQLPPSLGIEQGAVEHHCVCWRSTHL